MFNLDIPTLRVVALLLVVGTLTALLVFWKNHKFKVQTGFWIAGIVTYSISFVLVLVRDDATNVPVNVGIDLCKYASSMFFLYGIRKAQGRDTSLLPCVAIFIGLGIVSGYANYNSFSTQARIALVSGVTALMSLLSALALWQSPRFKLRSPEFAALVTFVFFGLLNVGRIVYIGRAEVIDFSFLTVSFYSSAFFIAALTFLLILMSHNQLEEDLALLMVRDKHENAAKLQRVEKRWLIALEYSNAGAWELHRDANTITLTSQWAKMLGMEETERTITLQEYLQFVHPDDWPKLREQRQRIEDGTSHVLTTEFRLKRN